MNERAGRFDPVIRKPDIKTIILFLWFANILTLTAARFFMNKIGVSEGLVRSIALWIVASVPLFLYCVYSKEIGFQNLKPFLVLFTVIVLAWAITAAVNPASREYLIRDNYGPERVFRPDCALFAYLFFVMFDDPKRLVKNTTIYAYLYFAYQIVFRLIPALRQGYWVIVSSTGEDLQSSYSLTFGYSMCFPTIIALYNSIKEKKLIHILLAVAGFMCILTNGNRGALLIIIIFIALMTVSGIIGRRNGAKRMIGLLCILICALLIYFFGNAILKAVLSLLGNWGISSRNINMLLEGGIAESNGREQIWNAVIDAIKSGGIFGYGVYGDRPFVSPIHYVGYSHNLFLELFVSFGIIGVLIALGIIKDAIQMLFFCKDTDWRELYIIFFSISCQLMLSLSFWYVWEFWAAAAIAYKYRYLKRRNKLQITLPETEPILQESQGC